MATFNNVTKLLKSATTKGRVQAQAPVTQAFIAVSLLVIVIVILVCPTATWSLLAILGALPAFLNALAAFIVALRSHAPAPLAPPAPPTAASEQSQAKHEV